MAEKKKKGRVIKVIGEENPTQFRHQRPDREDRWETPNRGEWQDREISIRGERL